MTNFQNASSLFSIFQTSLFNQGIFRVKISKLDGEERTMFITKSDIHIPVAQRRLIIENSKKGTSRRESKSTTLIKVWDFDNKGWKSFHDFQIMEVEMF